MAEEQKSVPSFEESLAELEAVVKQLESGELPLEKAIEVFERGIALSEACRKQLEAAETKVEILLRRNNEFEPHPFEPQEP
jgi:exodeoxyribonuclease VII small subunit